MAGKESASRKLQERQLAGLWLDGRAALRDEADAVLFIRSVGFALRDNATPALPMASMFQAAGEKRHAIELTNVLLAPAAAIETNVIADRLVLVHRAIMPSAYALRVRSRPPRLSTDAQRALEFIGREERATSGDVRRHLGVAGRKRPDPGDLALAELQREILVDRGPSSVPKKGIPYLSPEGFPYRLFEKAHPEIVLTASGLGVEGAVSSIIVAYLQAALFSTTRKLASIFKLLFSETEAHAAIETLVRAHKAQQTKTLVALAGVSLT